MSTNFQDASGEVRLVGTIYAPDATVGDVFTVQADKSLAAAPGGGSQTGTVRFVLLDEVTAADVATDKIPIYSLASGERIIGGGISAVVTPDAGNLVVGTLNSNATGDGGAFFASDVGGFASTTNAPPVVGPADLYASGASGPAPPFGAWEADTLYGSTYFQAVVAAGHAWLPIVAGTSGGSAPDFAGNIGGTVDDNEITWQDDGVLPTTGSLTAFLLIASALS